LRYFKDFTEVEIVQFALTNYRNKKYDELAYESYRRLQKNRRLSLQGWGCFYCGKGITKKTATLDHLNPLSRGGVSEGENIVACCFECNLEKGEMTAGEYDTFKKLHYATNK